MSELIATPRDLTRSIDQNSFLAALAYPFQDGYELWSDPQLTYTLNRNDANPDGRPVAPWDPALEDAIKRAIADIEAVTNLRFTEVPDLVNGTDGADIDFWYYRDDRLDLLGYSYGPGGAGVFINEAGVFQPEDGRGAGLTYGGLNYETVVHELLHNLGFAHPHPETDLPRGLPGVVQTFDDTGDFALNQSLFTVMSYNRNEQTDATGAPTTGQGFDSGAPVDRGYSLLGTFDIALLQTLYGANARTATGDDTYTLTDDNQIGTYYKTIWDAGGVDEIRYSGTRDAMIDLRAATLDAGDGAIAGGIVSRVDGVFGGFTIARDTLLENATGGAGNDWLIGNSAANTLIGGANNDTLEGGGGADILVGGDGDDLILGTTLAEAIADGFDFEALLPVVITLPDLPDPNVPVDPKIVAAQNAARNAWWVEQMLDSPSADPWIDFI